MKTVIVVVGIMLASSAFAQQAVDRDLLYQLSSMKALKEGTFEGFKPYSEIKKLGDFGIGTFENLDGEMIEMDGQVYRAGADGSIAVQPDDRKAPYVTTTFFDVDQTLAVTQSMDYAQMRNELAAELPDSNTICAIRIDGRFDYVKCRSVPAQKKPYPTLDEAIQHQSVFEFTNVTGRAVGFWFPAYMDGVQAPGFHLHFLKSDKTGGGHLLDFRMKDGTIQYDITRKFEMEIPSSL